MEYIIGIDTSCYTTSVCVVDINETLISDFRTMLKVNSGSRGLRQSEAVFQHMNNLPNLFYSSINGIDRNKIIGVAISTQPRRLKDSYMPVFMAAKNVGTILASALNVPLMEFSHQEGHIRAGIWSGNGPKTNKFLCIHLSGGTTELLKVTKEEPNFEAEIIGGTLDISAGQLIDRVGVYLGLDFPCGSQLEKLASRTNSCDFKIPSYVKDLDISFSGAETYVKNRLKDISQNNIAYGVQECIAKSLQKLVNNAINITEINEVLLVGGVASNTFIKKYLKDSVKCNFYFAEPKYSVDNSVGIALLGVDYAKTNNISK